MRRNNARSANSPKPAPASPARSAAAKPGSPLRALIIGGGIGGLAAAVALQRVGIGVRVFEKAPEVAEVGAGLSLWSNAILAARRLGVEADVVAAGSVIAKTRSFRSSGEPIDEFDVAALAATVGAPTVCVHRADLQRILLGAVLAQDPDAVQIGCECVGYDEEHDGITAVFADGSHGQGDVLIGADGIHSTLRGRLFGDEAVRYAGCYAWRGVAPASEGLLPDGQAFVVTGRGAHAGCFHCGGGRVYWFLTRNGSANSRAGPGGNRAEVLRFVENWRGPLRRFVEATDEADILRNDIVDRPPRMIWGSGRVTLLGDAIHAATPNLGQGACQALEDAIILADALRDAAEPETALREYEARRRDRANFVVVQSRRLGYLLQLANPLAVWLRDRVSRTAWGRRQTEILLNLLLRVELPELGC